MALSTAEAESVTAAVEVIYLRQLLRGMGFGPTSPAPVYGDNTACIEWTDNVSGGRGRAKHIDIRTRTLRTKRAARASSSQETVLHGSALRCVHQEPPAGTVRYDHFARLLRRNLRWTRTPPESPVDSDVAGVVRDVGPREGGRDSQREQSESTPTLTRGVSQ